MPASEVTWTIDVGSESVSAAYDPVGDGAAPVFVCAHGAGGNLSDRGVVSSTASIRRHGISTVRFNFVYRELKRGRPDPMPALMSCYAAVVAHVRAHLAPATLVIGGRSMGGRAASMLAAEGFASDGLLLLAYPLHPPGKPQQLRAAHLSAITMPVLCINGTRDEFCTPALMTEVLASVRPTWRMHWIDGADHSFHVLKSSGRTDAQVLEEIGRVAGDWVAGVATG